MAANDTSTAHRGVVVIEVLGCPLSRSPVSHQIRKDLRGHVGFLVANELAKEVHKLRVANPYYHLIRGDEAFEEGDFNLAHNYYRRAYRLDRTNHLILFALGKTALATGETDDAQTFLERAIKRAELPADRQRYAAKLAVLSHYYEEQL